MFVHNFFFFQISSPPPPPKNTLKIDSRIEMILEEALKKERM